MKINFWALHTHCSRTHEHAREFTSRAAGYTITSKAELWLVRDRQTSARDRDRDSRAISEHTLTLINPLTLINHFNGNASMSFL